MASLILSCLLPPPSSKFNSKTQSIFAIQSNGVKTQRDAWAYNFSKTAVRANSTESIDYYNETLDTIQAGQRIDLDYETSKISWTEAVQRNLQKGQRYNAEEAEVRRSIYRPFCKQHLFWYTPLIERRYRTMSFFPTAEHENLVICVNGLGSTKGFTSLITENLPDLNLLSAGAQCFPLYWYEEDKAQQSTDIFDEPNMACWERRDGVTDWIQEEIRSRFEGTKYLTKEDIFYYVYGLLHSPDYRLRFADDLRKSLPRIPIVERAADFMAFSKAGRALADLHLNYECHRSADGVVVIVQGDDKELTDADADYALYRVNKMRFPAKGERSTIIYNNYITIENIPEEAYNYVVNGRTAIEWIMDRYAVRIDKKSGIKNDPNLWPQEQGKPRYILDLLLSVIHVSIETTKLVDQLPKLSFE